MNPAAPRYSLTVDRVCRDFPTRTGALSVLRNVSLSLSGGEALAIMGASGSGKSTLLHILGSLDQPTSGKVSLDGVDPFTLAEEKLAEFRNRKVGFVFQDHHLLPQCTVFENVLIPAVVNREVSRGDMLDRAEELLTRVGLAERLDHLPAELSGGERQRVAVARALLHRPALLLADEPTGNLDRATAQQISELLFELHQQEGNILVVVTHSPELARVFPTRRDMVDGALS